jgi:hypothetical protein
MSLVLLAGLALAASPVGDSLPDPLTLHAAPAPRRIDTIVLLPHGALEGSKILTAGDSLAYDIAEWLRDNVFHSRTSPNTVRARLGFREGDPVDSLRLAESERSLRTEKFLADAKVRRQDLPDGRTAVEVETWDRWSTTILASLARSGGETSWLLGAHEANLAGTGQDVAFWYSSSSVRSSWTESYTNTAFLLPGGLFSLTWAELTDGHQVLASVGQPVRTVFQEWAWGLDFSDLISTRRSLASRSQRETLDSRYDLAWSEDSWLSSMPRSRNRTARFSVSNIQGRDTRLQISGIAESELDSASTPRSAFGFDTTQLAALRADPELHSWLRRPSQRDDRRLGMSVSVQSLKYARLRNFNQLKWTEDIPTGWKLTGTAMANVLSRGDVRDDGYLYGQGSWTGIEGAWYGTAAGAWKSFFRDGDPQAGSAALRTEGRWLAAPGVQAIANASSQVVTGVPVGVTEVSLGEDNGLPGYPARYLSGRGLFLSTAEVRWALPLEALTVAPALALVAGAGRVSDGPDVLGDGPWRQGVGFGIRLGMTRSPAAIVNHLTFSVPVGRDSKLGWLISFGAKQTL